MDHGVGSGKPQGALDCARAANEIFQQSLRTLSVNRRAGDFDLRAGSFLQARGQADAAAGQDHGDVARANPNILYGEVPALFEKTAMQPPGDFIRLKHRL
jgi:hypothetical protein